ALGHPLRVAARVRPEDHGPALHRRLTGRAVPRAAGALLPVWLGPTTRDGRAVLGRRRALAAVRELANHRLVHDGLVGLFGEDQLGQPDLALAPARGVEERRVQRVRLLLLFLLLPSLGRGLGLGHQTFLGLG